MHILFSCEIIIFSHMIFSFLSVQKNINNYLWSVLEKKRKQIVLVTILSPTGLTATTPTGTVHLRHHDRSPTDSATRDSREGAGYPGDGDSRGDRDSRGYPGDRDSRGYPGDRGSRGYAGSPGDRGSKDYYPTQEDIANEARQRGATDQYGSPDYRGVAGYRDPHGESRTPGSRDSYGTPGTRDSYGAPGPRDSYGAPGTRDSYGAPGTRDSFGRTPGSRDSYGSPDSRSPGSGYPTQEDQVFTER